MVEHSAVNRRVVSSSLTRGAKNNPGLLSGFFIISRDKINELFPLDIKI